MKKRLANKIIKTITTRRHSIPRIMRAYFTLGREYVKTQYGITDIRIQKGYILISDEVKRVDFDKPCLVIDQSAIDVIQNWAAAKKSRYSEAPLDSSYYRTISFKDLKAEIEKE